MDPGFLDKLSADGLYNLRAAIQARICQFHERSGNETPSQPNLSHGNRLPTRPDNMPSTIQDRGIERRFHHQRDLETITQVQGQPISSSFSQVPSGLNLENSVNQEIEPLGPGELPERLNSMLYAYLRALGRAPFPAQSYVAKPPALVQPEQTWARGPAASLSVFKSDSLVPQNPQSPTLCSVGWPEVSRWQLRGEAQVADWNASQPYAAENDSTWQHGMRRPAVLGQQMQYHPVHLLGSSRSLREPDGSPSARNRTRPITSGAFVGGSISQLGILSQQLQPSAAYDHSLDGRLTDFGDSEPAPNGMNSMTSAALIGKNMRWPPPAVLRQYSEPYQIYDLSGNVWPMGFGSPVPISNGSALPRLERTKVPRVQSSRSCGTIRAKKRAHDEMANAGTNKNLQAKKKRGYPNNNQKDHANWVREIGACARCTKQHNKVIVTPCG
jgi:hypothetical protein